MRRLLILGSVAAALFSSAAGMSITDNSLGPVSAQCTCCRSDLIPSPIVYLPPGGADAAGQLATLVADFPGVNVVLGGPAPGSLTIDRYNAWCLPGIGGAHIRARYNDGVAGPTWQPAAVPPAAPNVSYRWIQEINTNKPLGGVGAPYIDPRPNDDPPGTPPLPYYWTDAETLVHTNGVNANGPFDLDFSDVPRRECDQEVFWWADLFLVSENQLTDPSLGAPHQITIYDGIRWGFDLTPTPHGFVVLRDIHITDTVTAAVDGTITWGEGQAISQLFGAQTVATVHAGDVQTTASGDVVSESFSRLEAFPDEFYRAWQYSFTVEAGSTTGVYYINDLDAMSIWDLTIPVVAYDGVSDLVYVLDLDKDQLAIFDASLPYQRRDTALYLGSFDSFSASPTSFSFDLLGTRRLELEHTLTVPEPLTVVGLLLATAFTCRTARRRLEPIG